MTQDRHDRIFPLRRLNSYPGGEWLDVTFWLPKAENAVRRVWAMVPESSPTICIDDAKLEPKRICKGPPRWIDYGQGRLQTHFSQLRVGGMKVAECADSYLLVTARLDFSPEGCTIDQAERMLWGLARCDAGSTTLRPGRRTAGEKGQFCCTYSAGAGGLPAGAMVRFTVPRAFDRPQAEDPDCPGFIEIARADRPVSIAAIEDCVESHTQTDVLCRLDDGLQSGEGFEIRYRSDKAFLYSNLFCCVDRPYWYCKTPPLSAAAAVSQEHPFVSLAEENAHTFEFAAGPAERLHLFLPGRRFASEELSLRGVFTDRYRNSPPAGPVDAELELWLVSGAQRIALGTPAGRFGARHRFEIPLPALRPGVYRAVACRSGDGGELARSNPLEIIAADSGGERIYWGEIHAHTEMSDGCGEYGQLYRHARREGCLDFAAAADHACYFSDNQWQWMQDVTNSWSEPGRFVTLVGYEWAGKQSHRNVYTSRDRLELFRGMYEPTSNLDVVWRHFHGDEEVVGGPHAPLAHGLNWAFHDPEVERFVEMYSMWGANDFRDGPLAPLAVKAGDKARGLTVNELLGQGAKLGFTGGGDCHEGRAGFSVEDPTGQGTTTHTFAAGLPYRCGMTAAVMPRLDRKCLIRAIRSRRTYATTGARILLDFTAAGVAMGSVGRTEQAECRAAVHAVDPIRTMEIVKDGNIAWSAGAEGLDAAVTWTDPEPLRGEHYYYLRVVQADGQMAWSGPIWLRRAAEE